MDMLGYLHVLIISSYQALTQVIFSCHDRCMVDASVVVLPPDQDMPSDEEKVPGNSQSLTALIVFLFIAIIACGGFFTYLLLGVKKTPTPVVQPSSSQTAPKLSSISGTVYFQGYAPANSYIAIAERGTGETDFKDVVSGLTPDPDGTTEWTWKDAKVGENYEIKATLKEQGKVIDASPV